MRQHPFKRQPAIRTLVILLAFLMISGCSPLRLVNMMSAENDSTTLTQVSYGSGSRQQLDVYVPEEIVEDSPVLIFFYGGSWKRGEKQKYGFVAQSLSSMGYLTVIPDYRLYPEVTFPAFVEDGATALAWVSRNIDQAKNGMVVMGHSAGAHLAALLALDHRYLQRVGLSPSIIRGMVGLAGPYGFNPLEYRSTRPIFSGVEPIDQARPVSFACFSEAPILLFHGVDDSLVIPQNSLELKRRVNNCGGAVEYHELDDTGHFSIVLGLSDSFFGKKELLTILQNFLQEITRQQKTNEKPASAITSIF